jgi:hypothetical protein
MNCPSQKYAVSVPASVLASASRPGKLQFLDPFAAPACPQGTFQLQDGAHSFELIFSAQAVQSH